MSCQRFCLAALLSHTLHSLIIKASAPGGGPLITINTGAVTNRALGNHGLLGSLGLSCCVVLPRKTIIQHHLQRGGGGVTPCHTPMASGQGRFHFAGSGGGAGGTGGGPLHGFEGATSPPDGTGMDYSAVLDRSQASFDSVSVEDNNIGREVGRGQQSVTDPDDGRITLQPDPHKPGVYHPQPGGREPITLDEAEADEDVSEIAFNDLYNPPPPPQAPPQEQAAHEAAGPLVRLDDIEAELDRSVRSQRSQPPSQSDSLGPPPAPHHAHDDETATARSDHHGVLSPTTPLHHPGFESPMHQREPAAPPLPKHGGGADNADAYSAQGSPQPASQATMVHKPAAVGGASLLRATSSAPPPPRPPPPFPSVAPSPSSTVLVDVASVASVLEYEVNLRRHMRWCMKSTLYFVLIVLVAVLHTNVTEAHYVTTALADGFVEPRIRPDTDKTLADITNPGEVFDWLNNVWAPALFEDFTPGGVSAVSQATVARYNKVIQTPYLKVRRRAPARTCYGTFIKTPLNALGVEDVSRYCHSGLSSMELVGASTRRYVPVTGLDADSRTGGDEFYVVFRVNDASYGAVGAPYTVHNVSGLASVRAVLQSLKEDGFFSETCEDMEVPVIVYNPYTDLMGAMKIMFDVSGAGVVHAFSSNSLLHVARISWYNDGKDSARFVLELVFMITTFIDALFTYRAMWKAMDKGSTVLAFFTSRSWAWNWFEVFFVVVALVAFSLYTRLIVEQPSLPERLQLIDGRFDPFSNVYAASKSINGVLIALTGVKVVRYLGFVPGWASLILAFQRIVLPLATFVVTTVILCLGFSAAGHYALGASHGGMSTFGGSLQTVLSFYTNSVGYDELSGPATDNTQGVFPPMYYWTIFVMMSIIVTGVVVAIAVVSYVQAKEGAKSIQKVKRAAQKWQVLAPRQEWWFRLPGSSVFDTFPKAILETLGEVKKWIVPVMVDYSATSTLVAEVGGGTLRVYVGVQSWFQRKLVGARAFVAVLPPGAFVPGLGKVHTGYIAKVAPGQALHMTTEPLLGAQEFEFIVDGSQLRTRGGVDLGMSEDHQVILEFPGVINDAYDWGAGEVVVNMDTCKRISTYGGSFTHSPADWLVCAVGAPSALQVCPYLVLEPHVPLEELLDAVDHCGIEEDADFWRHSVTCLAQMFSKTVDTSANRYQPSPRLNPLEVETVWQRDSPEARNSVVRI